MSVKVNHSRCVSLCCKQPSELLGASSNERETKFVWNAKRIMPQVSALPVAPQHSSEPCGHVPDGCTTSGVSCQNRCFTKLTKWGTSKLTSKLLQSRYNFSCASGYLQVSRPGYYCCVLCINFSKQTHRSHRTTKLNIRPPLRWHDHVLAT